MDIIAGIILIGLGLYKIISEIDFDYFSIEPLPKTDFKNAPKPNTILKGQKGKLRINLKWDSLDDLDLYVVDPCGNEIYYGNKNAGCKGSNGTLDKDANFRKLVKNPQENIFWNGNPPIGNYKVSVKHHKKNQFKNVQYLLSILTSNSKLIFKGTAFEGEKTSIVDFYFSENRISIKRKNALVNQI
jgi:uncharacterized protein YfaP (DUF2135 family)